MAHLLKVEQAAKEIGLSRHTLYKLVGRGKIPFYRAGRAVRFDLQELRTWMRQQTITQ